MHLLISQTVHIFCYFPISFLTYFILGRMLKIRRVGLFAFGLTMIHVLYHILYTLAVMYEVPYADLGRTVGQIAIDLIVPVLVLKRKPGLIILGVSLVLLAAVFGELAGIATSAVKKQLRQMTDKGYIERSGKNGLWYVFAAPSV